MPVYEYKCDLCGEVMSAVVPYDQRRDSRPCEGCHLGMALYQMPAPRIGSERKRGDRRLIWDERQVEAEHGKGWRDKGTTGKPGGAGAKLTFDQGSRK